MPEPERVDAARVVVYRDDAGEFRWTAHDTNGEKVADSGEGYDSWSYACQAASDLFPNAELDLPDREDGA